MSPSSWPRRTVDPTWWKWRVVLSFGLRLDHINVQELRGALASLEWRLRTSTATVRSRLVHFLDSQVTIGLLTKGRTSSLKLQNVLRRYDALMLASSAVAAYVYIRTDLNPADAPSRWPRSNINNYQYRE